jgi:hypothetical protein
VTPILVRPVREQLEHDRVIRELQVKWRRKYAVAANQGAETTTAVPLGEGVIYPDLILTLPGGRRPAIVVEVETGESVNNLEAMAEWVRMGQSKAEFHLYVPTGSVAAARRLCEEHRIPVAEIWAYHRIGDEIRFSSIYKAPVTARHAPHREAATTARPSAASARPAVSRRRPGAPSPRKAAARRPAKPAAAKRSHAKKAPAKAARSQKRK